MVVFHLKNEKYLGRTTGTDIFPRELDHASSMTCLQTQQKIFQTLIFFMNHFNMFHRVHKGNNTLIHFWKWIKLYFFQNIKFVWKNVLKTNPPSGYLFSTPFYMAWVSFRATALGEPPQQRSWCHAQARLITFSNRNFHLFEKKGKK